MDDNPETPLDPFDLPEWGSGDAPALELQEDRAVSAVAGPVPTLVLSTLPVATGGAVIGLVSALGSAEAESGRMDEAVASARDAALDRLMERGIGVGASGVAGVSFSIIAHKSQVVVLAAGTALRPES